LLVSRKGWSTRRRVLNRAIISLPEGVVMGDCIRATCSAGPRQKNECRKDGDMQREVSRYNRQMGTTAHHLLVRKGDSAQHYRDPSHFLPGDRSASVDQKNDANNGPW
jgi:hypothetical protein